MNEFHNTLMGRKFYEADVPRIVKALERIATALENQVDIEEMKQLKILKKYHNLQMEASIDPEGDSDVSRGR